MAETRRLVFEAPDFGLWRDMMRFRRGQNVVEFAVLIAIIAAAFFAMNMYAKRGIQAGLKGLSDELGTQESKSNLPEGAKVVSHSENTDESDGTTEIIWADGGSRDMIVDQTSHTSGSSETVSETPL